jgi:translocator protein
MHTQVQQRSVLDHPWRLAALIAIVANVVFNVVSSWSHSLNVADTSARFPSLFTPAGYTFAIWAVIYGATVAYGVLAITPAQLEVRLHDRVAPWLLLTNVLSMLWIGLFTSEQMGPSVLVILAMLTSSYLAYSIANEHSRSEGLSQWWRAPFALWLGWLAVATLANLSLALVAAGGMDSPFASPIWACAMLIVAAAAALAVNMVYGDAVVPLVVSWAATGIAVARWEDSTLVAVVAALVALKTLLWAGATLLFDVFPIPQRYRQAAGKALHYDPAHPDGL